jgi:hypothetical protein
MDAHWPRHDAEPRIRMLLPSGPRRLRNLPQRERGRFRDHLNRIIAAAVSGEEIAAELPGLEPTSGSAPAPGASTIDLRGRLCACCGGGCCTRGGSTAYLSAATIRRYMASRPGVRPREVLAAYLDRLGNRHEAGSCVLHTAQGCGLPPEMRSQVCNRFLCEPLAELRDRVENREVTAVEGVIVVVRRQDHWRKDAPDRPNEIVGRALVTARAITRLPSDPGGPVAGTAPYSGRRTPVNSTPTRAPGSINPSRCNCSTPASPAEPVALAGTPATPSASSRACRKVASSATTALPPVADMPRTTASQS